MAHRVWITLIFIPATTYLFFSNIAIPPSVQGVLLTIGQGIVLYWSRYKPNPENRQNRPNLYWSQVAFSTLLAWGAFLAILSVSLLILVSPDFDTGLKYVSCFYLGIIFGLWFIPL